MSQPEAKFYPPVIPDIEDWPIYRLSEDRKQFVDDIRAFTFDRLVSQHPDDLGDLIAKTIYLERIRIKEEPWKVDPPKEKQFWKKISSRLVQRSLDRAANEAESSNRTLLQTIIHRYAEEIVGTFRIQTFLFARRFLTFFFTRLLNTAALRSVRGLWGSRYQLLDKLTVYGNVEEVRSLMKKGTVVVVPTHFSNLDSILIGYALDACVGLPSFSYGAGLNLYNTGYTAYFMNRLGAYRVDRRKKNPVYLETLKAMSNLSIQRGVNSLFFPGGTRSRSGELETRLKLGLLSTTVEAQRAIFQQGRKEKVFIVPLILGYHFVLEAEFLIEQHLRQMGRERYLKLKDESYSPWKVLQYTWRVFSQGNDINLSLGQPMDVLGNRVDAEGNSYDQHGRPIQVEEFFQLDGAINTDLQRESVFTQRLAERIVERYHRDNVVLSSHLVAFAAFKLLTHQHPKLDLYGILRLPPEDYVFPKDGLLNIIRQLQDYLRRREAAEQIKLSPECTGTPEDLLLHGISRLGTFHLKKPLRFDKQERIVSESFKLLYFYHNRLKTYNFERVIKWEGMANAQLLVQD